MVENYDSGKRGSETAERDRIYIIGFSRGAYSARVLAGFIHAEGLIEPRNLNLIGYAYRAYRPSATKRTRKLSRKSGSTIGSSQKE